MNLCHAIEILSQQVDPRVRMQHQAYRTEVRMPYASLVLIAPVVHKAEFERCDVMLITESQPGIEGRTLIALIENVRAFLAPRQRHVTVDPSQPVPDRPAPQGQQAPHLITAVAGA